VKVEHIKTTLRVGGTILSIIGAASLDIGFRLDMATLTSFQKFSVALVIGGVVAVLLSYVIGRGSARRSP
jgi:hypothetical protein